MNIQIPKVIEEHLRFARIAPSHVSKQILLSDLLKNLFNIGLEDIILGIEKDLKSSVKGFRGKTDLLYQNIIFEVKRKLDLELEDGEKQLKKYFQALHESNPNLKHIGLITDCINFIEYVPVIKNDEVTGIRRIGAINLEEINHNDSVLWLDAILFSKTKIFPKAEDFKFRFGLESPTYNIVLDELEIAWEKIKDMESSKIKIELWKKNMEIVYGRKPTGRSFLDQTFLVLLVKLLVYLRIHMLDESKELNVSDALTGKYFKDFGISNLVEEGYYSWVLDEKVYYDLEKTFKILLRQLMRYEISQINEDLFKEIYQEIVRKEDRHRLGEYYTPEWLAELTLLKAIEKHNTKYSDKIPSILDPACGSGTFLTNAIHILKKKLKKRKARAHLEKVLTTIRNNVVGVDINPLAVYIARANYIFALGDLLAFKKDIFTIPVYVADTFQLTNIENLDEVKNGVYEINADGEKLSIPYSVLKNQKKYEHTINQFEKIVTNYRNKERVEGKPSVYFRHTLIFTQREIEILNDTLKNLLKLIDEGRNSIWIFILSNDLAPWIFKQRKFDILIGNPPWIAMRFMENEDYQEYLKSKAFQYELIDQSKIQLFSNMEMATVFFNNSVDLYLKKHGTIAFVMPRSIITGAMQHNQFREFRKPTLKLNQILDFEKVKPLFNVPSCTIICTNGRETSYPVPILKFEGIIESKNMSLDKTLKHIVSKEGSYSPPILKGERSPYYDKFKMGSRLAPRPFWFIDFVVHPILRINPKAPNIKTTEKSRKQAKGNWKKVDLHGIVESEYIYATLLSKDLLPFGYTKIRPVFVPTEPTKNSFNLLSVSDLQHAGSMYASKWLNNVESFWKEYGSKKSEKNFPSVLDRVDYQNLLSLQNPSKRFILLYVASGTYIVSSVIDRTKISEFKMDHISIKPTEFIVESKTWFLESNNENEVHYLCSILNSKVLSENVNRLQTRGLWGARDIHRRPFLFNIPLFQEDDENHLRLAEISKATHSMVSKIKKTGTHKGISGKRRRIQKVFFKEFKEIDKLVKDILNIQNN